MTGFLIDRDVPAFGAEPEDGAPREPAALVSAEFDRLRLNGWSIEPGEFWTHVRPASQARRIQGWKLHVSATIVSAAEVLRVCLPPIVASGSPFKFAGTLENLRDLNDFRTPRGNSGKFITVYPADDGVLGELAERLHEVTLGLDGPAVLSDVPFRKGSLVHARYGGFDGVRALSNDGRYRNCLVTPDGGLVEDEREGVFRPPPWTDPPFGAARPSRNGGGGPVLLREGYQVASAIRHANKGGVYRALDRRTGAEVIVKEARPHVASDALGRHAGDFLRHEARVLRHLAGLGVVPSVVDEFTQDGHRFLVEELIAGETLYDKVATALEKGSAWPPGPLVRDLVSQLARTLQAVHGAGVVVRDLSPNNVLITDDGRLRLIDLELAAVLAEGKGPSTGRWDVFGIGGGTPGFSAPEQRDGAAPDFSADLFSLGALALFLATQTDPSLADDRPEGHPLEDRIVHLLTPPLGPPDIDPVTHDIVTGLMRSAPVTRIPLTRVLRMASGAVPLVRPVTEREAIGGFDYDAWGSLVSGMLGHLAANLPADPDERPWPETGFGTEAEPCTVQHGLAGGLAVLARFAELGLDGDAGGHVARLLDAVVPRVTRHLGAAEHRLPGLHFGFAGTAWALFDAGRALDRPDLSALGLELASGLPTAWPVPDVTHGLAGLGSCLLHLARETGDRLLLAAAGRCADHLLETAEHTGDAVSWRTPESFDSELAGYRSYGYAHGVAGIGAFLLAAGRATGRDELLGTALRCGETLLGAAIPIGDAAYWPDRVGTSRPFAHWCNGSSGVGGFLCRLHVHTGDPRYLDAAVAAGRAVLRSRRRSGASYCHGLAGNGDFLLDLAEVEGTGRHKAEVLAALLWARRLDRDGRAVLPDETGRAVTGGYGVGLFGHLAFLQRLRFGGPRLFHLEARPAGSGGVQTGPEDVA
ncbi:class IV lanthionine synthetase LanL [Actinomadura decatromicini]|uniref:non-specific serine/threonine protein kinase n=1 Tax=Actinomadura decatromicini TaxID=2604572 RepID=A0A5D3F800_9ACTN|nr:class IV lanthionine synthetase LanL [Actinomadura decatromicini]TYK44303.1 protein kinase/lanthionine synthetase C family protein [Actinomadura decatromicini]